MRYITNKTELKEYVFRALGSEAHEIEISDDNFEDMYNDTLRYIQDRTDDGVNRQVALMDLGGSREIVLDDTVMAIHRLLEESSIGTSNNLYYYSGVSPVYDFIKGGAIDTSSYLIFNEKIREYNQLFTKRISYSFNSESKKLILHQDDITKVMLDYYVVEDEEYLYNHELFKMYLEMLMWKQWYINTNGKYIGSTIGNGITINGEFMLSQYDRLYERVQLAIENEEFDMLLPRKLT